MLPRFASGSTVTLTATPTGGSTFAGWGGACSGTGPCVVVMNGSQTVAATFTAAPTTLTINKTGRGPGLSSAARPGSIAAPPAAPVSSRYRGDTDGEPDRRLDVCRLERSL